jgi:hypothetical protein
VFPLVIVYTTSSFSEKVLHPQNYRLGIKVAARELLTLFVGENSPAILVSFQDNIKVYFTRPSAYAAMISGCNAAYRSGLRIIRSMMSARR